MTLLIWYSDDDPLQYAAFTPVNPFNIRLGWEIGGTHQVKENICLSVVGYCPSRENGAPEMVIMNEEGKLMPITDYLDVEVRSVIGEKSPEIERALALSYSSVEILGTP